MVRRAMNLEEQEARGGEWEGRCDKWAFFTSPQLPSPKGSPRMGALSQSAPRMASSPAREIPSSGACSCSPPPKPRHVPRPCTPSTTAHIPPAVGRFLSLAISVAWARAQPRLISQLRPHRTSKISNHPHSSRCRVFFSSSTTTPKLRVFRTGWQSVQDYFLGRLRWSARRRWWTGLINRP